MWYVEQNQGNMQECVFMCFVWPALMAAVAGFFRGITAESFSVALEFY